MRRVYAAEIAVLAVVWLAGLWIHTIALCAALPGLSHRRAFFLNVSGSAVSNLLPLGGTAGSAVNYWATKTWGFSAADFLRWAAVTNIWDVLSRLAVPGVAQAWLAAEGSSSPPLRDAAVSASAALMAFSSSRCSLFEPRPGLVRPVGSRLESVPGYGAQLRPGSPVKSSPSRVERRSWGCLRTRGCT